MTDYKAVLDSMLQEIETGTLKADQEDGMAFVSGALANDEFAKLGLNTMIETAKKAAGLLMSAESKADITDVQNGLGKHPLDGVWIPLHEG